MDSRVVAVAALAGLLGAASCGDPLTAPPSERPSVEPSRWDVAVARVFDQDERFRAVGVELPGLAAATEGTDAARPLKLGILRRSDGRPVWPVGDRPVLDAALGARPGVVAYLPAEGGAVCVAGPGTQPACRAAPAVPGGLDVAPDGRVVFVAATGVGTNIWVVDPRSTAGPRRLTFGEARLDRPIFDPAGERVAFVGPSTGGLASLFEVEARGGLPRQITNVGLALRAASDGGDGSGLPEGFVPPPTERSAMQWDGEGFRYGTVGRAFAVDTASGETTEIPEEEVVR